MSKVKQAPADSRHASIPASIPTCVAFSIPTWGYHAEQGARLFALAPGGQLPAGWADVPRAGQHPHDAERAIRPSADAEVATDAPARRRPRGARK